MSNPEDFWKDKVLNPSALGQAEKDLWIQIEPLLNDLLDELKTKGKIQTSFTAREMEHLGSLIHNLTQISVNYNSLIDLFESEEKIQAFHKATYKFGFDEPKWVNLYVELGVLHCVLSTELFKALLLFHLKDVDHHISRFLIEMEKAAPKTWRKLKPYVDNAFRNSLAHGAWTVENRKIVLFEDAKLEPYDELDLTEFMIRIKNQNVLYMCLVNALSSRKKTMFFT